MKTAVIVTGIALGVWLAYQGVTSAAFVYEDHAWLTDAPAMSRWLTRESWIYLRTPSAAHLLNLGLFTLTGLAWYAVARGLRLSQEAAIFGAGLWLLLPMNVETVAYAASRSELIAILGVLTAGACLLTLGAWGWLPAAVALGLGYLGKESALIGGPLIALWLAAQARWRAAAVLTMLGIVAAVAVGGFTYISTIGLRPTYQNTPIMWALAQSAAVVHHLWLSLPFASHNVDYDYDRVTLGARVLSLGGLAWLAVLAAGLWRTHRPIAVGIAWCLIAVSPRLVIQTPGSYLNDHQFALAFGGIVFAGVAAYDALLVRVPCRA